MLYSLDARFCRHFELSSQREWLLTNGIGGFAMGTVSGANMRRYHAHLVAAVHPPADRVNLLANVEVTVQGDGNPIGLSCNQYAGAVHPEGYHFLESFEATEQAVTWRYRAGGMALEKLLAMRPGQNAVTMRYRNIGERPIGLVLRPLVLHRGYHENFRSDEGYPAAITFPKHLTVIEHADVPLILHHEGAQRFPAAGWYYRFEYTREVERGLDGREDLYCPCELRYELMPGEQAVLDASVERKLVPLEIVPGARATSLGGMLSEAASVFFVATKQRTTIIAGYPWFTDWGRDTMIALPGLCLHTGRVADARKIILDFAGQMKQGLIPNRFVESGEEPEYNTVDATLWFANAIYKTLEAEWHEAFARKALTALRDTVDWHLRGTLYGIGVDPADGLLRQGEPGVQLTWMDAKVGDWVVTPRHGKPVEINGLWINALRVAEWLAKKLGEDASVFAVAAEKAESNFDAAFWRELVGHYLDTADPDDASLRPNQLIAMALPFGPAKGPNAVAALQKITRELLTPHGL